MKLLYKLIDDQYELKGEAHDRKAARAIIINEKKEVLMNHLLGDDIFGHRDYYETPGGGVDENETPEQAVIREAQEETGYICRIIDEIGIVDDYYNLINTHNISYYYLLKVVGEGPKNLDQYEKKVIDKVVWADIDSAIKLIEDTVDEPLAILVKRRELPIYKLAKEMIKKI